ncbi:MAG: C25 family cysteine peptidase [Bacteroidetes bacterium]|nr:C25 family cysteine peptidase [Bacteroidota bacterium]
MLLVGGIKFLPSYKVESIFASDTSMHEDSVSIDEWYSINSNAVDTKPDIAIGRFPVNNDQELGNIISKTIFFEDSLSRKSYPTDFLFLTDKKDSAAFNYEVNQFITSTVPSNYSNITIFAGNDSSIEITRKHLFNSLNKGCLFLSYYGHGAPDRWSQYNLFTYEDIDSLKQNSLPFIFTSASCSQNFDLPNDSSIVKKIMVIKNNGAIATIASSGISLLSIGSSFLQTFYQNIFSHPLISIGDAFLQTKLTNENIDYSDGKILQRYTLLGDPALKISSSVIASNQHDFDNVPARYGLEQNYPNPFNPSTEIQYQISKPGSVSIKVFDILGREVASLINEEKQIGTYTIKFSANNLSSGIYFYRMQVTSTSGGNIFSSVKKMILLK